MLLKQKKYTYRDMITLSFKTSPLFSIIFAVKSIIDALLPTFSIFITADFINTAIAVVNGESFLSEAYRPIALLITIALYHSLINVLMNFLNGRRQIIFRQKLMPEIVERQAKLKYQYIENAETADLLYRVCPRFHEIVWDMFTRVLYFLYLFIYVGGIIITLFTQVWWVALMMLVTIMPIIIVSTNAGKQSYEADKTVSKVDRVAKYLSEIMRKREAFEERSIFNTTESLNSQYKEKYEHARKVRIRVMAWNFTKQKIVGIITILYSIGVMLVLMPNVIHGSMTLGIFISIMNAVFDMTEKMSWGVNLELEDLARKVQYLNDLTKFMELGIDEDATSLPEEMIFNTIEFQHVSFRYPGTDTLILDDVSFTIQKGRHYSFVGANGAGKTTITKLITGLYTNYEGKILVDGRSLRDFSQAEIKGLASVVYQDFARYSISLRDNIAISASQYCPNSGNIENSVELVGLSETVKKLSNGFDTLLGKIVDGGIDLSGGEWQRIALARCVANPAPLKILDEPTAALDPVSESMLYHNFEDIAKGQTTLFISHRLGSTKLADIIYVLSDGKIVESGSHDELMAKNGVYCEMFNAQSLWYKAEPAGKERENA